MEFFGDPCQRPCAEIYYSDLAKRSFRDLVETFFTPISSRVLAKRLLFEILRRDLEHLNRYLLHRSWHEVSCMSYRNLARGCFMLVQYGDLARRPVVEISRRDFVKRTEILLRDLSVRQCKAAIIAGQDVDLGPSWVSGLVSGPGCGGGGRPDA